MDADRPNFDLTVTPLAQWAATLRELYEALTSQGFTEEQALTIVVAFMRPQVAE